MAGARIEYPFGERNAGIFYPGCFYHIGNSEEPVIALRWRILQIGFFFIHWQKKTLCIITKNNNRFLNISMKNEIC